jgi:hypothetical protein
VSCNHSQETAYIACIDCDIEHATLTERERINGIIEQFIENSDYPEVVSSLQWLQDVIKGESK